MLRALIWKMQNFLHFWFFNSIFRFRCRETTLHALRGIITPAGEKMSEPIKKQIHATLLTYLGQPEETVRKCAAGCLGAICKYLSPEQLDATLSEHLLSK